nr:N-acetyl-glucosamine transferase [Kibdelosporangium sp. MJ126-NF4]
MNHVVGVAAVVVLSFSLTYFVTMVVKGVRLVRRSRLKLRDQEKVAPDSAFSTTREIYFLVAALNEAEVIGETVRRLGENGDHVTVVVVDDGSDDGTGPLARAASHRAVVVRRDLPEARQGKGEALNAGLGYILNDVRKRGLRTQDVVLCVMDADGRLSDGAVTRVLPLFDEETVGGVQLSVRIRNTDKLITRFQDVEFWMVSALTQFGRVGVGTVSLGGNGQFTRLAAVLELGERPWSKSLTEDLDLSISLNIRGWRTVTTPHAYVDQQGVTKYRALVKQRTRWYQGTMQCAGRIPEIWRSRKLSTIAALELCAYVLVPWLVVLPWSVIQHYALVQGIIGTTHIFPDVASGSPVMRISYAVFWYIASFFPNIMIGVLYGRRTKQVGMGKAFLLGHGMLVWNYVGYLATYKALWRILRRQTSWAKTARVAETPAGMPDEGRHAMNPAALSVQELIAKSTKSPMQPGLPAQPGAKI